jgi:hypothetical protein
VVAIYNLKMKIFYVNLNSLLFRLPISIVVGLILSWVWLNVLDPPPSYLVETYKFAVWGVAISCVIDMLGEAPNLATKAFYFNYFRVSTFIIL